MKKKYNPKTLAARLKAIRKQRNLTTDRMAAELDICVNGYRKCEIGRNSLSQQTQILLAERFDISLDWLLLAKGPMQFSDIEKALRENVELKQEIRKLKEQQEQQQRQLEKTTPEPPRSPNTVEVTTPEVRELLQYMEDNPMFKFQLLAHFYRMKQEGPKQGEIPLPG